MIAATTADSTRVGRLKPGVEASTAAGSELQDDRRRARARVSRTPTPASPRPPNRWPDRLVDDIRLDAARAARRRRLPAADRLRQRRQPADCARRVSPARARRARRARRRPRAAGGQMLVESTSGVERPAACSAIGARRGLLRGLIAVAPEGMPRIDERPPRRRGAAVRAGAPPRLRRRVRRVAGISGIRRPGSAGAGAHAIGGIASRDRTGCAAG